MWVFYRPAFLILLKTKMLLLSLAAVYFAGGSSLESRGQEHSLPMPPSKRRSFGNQPGQGQAQLKFLKLNSSASLGDVTAAESVVKKVTNWLLASI